jgi:CBS domain-containing protein
MTIAMILAEKGREVITAHERTTLREAAESLVRHGIGALVIVDAASAIIVGLIAERDIVSAVALDGSTALDQPVTQYMQASFVPAHDNDTVHEIMQIMTLERRRHIPVTSEGRLSGLVSIGDVVKHRLRVIEEEHRSMREYIAQA